MNFEVLDYFPEGSINKLSYFQLPFGSSQKGKRRGNQKVNLINLYTLHKEDQSALNSGLLRPAHWIKFSNEWGFNFKLSAAWYGTPIAYEHAVEILFPIPFLITGFVVRGGLEKWNNFNS
ncbi:unnamed protein product [Gordionus sp. m RMFG-2023]